MPIRGIQDYLSSGEATEEYFNNTDEGSQLLTKTEIVDLQTNPENLDSIQFTPQDVDPAHTEGRVYYDNAHKALSVIADEPDFVLNLGQEEVIRVRNVTGANILNGTPCYLTGASSGLPTIAPAIADSLSTSVVPGIATHDIANGQAGFITHAGVLGGDFSSFTNGDILYLSDTVAGEYVTTPPDITTVLGSVLDNGVEGSLLVRIASHVALPTAIGYLQILPGTFTADVAYTNLAGYSNSDSVYVGANPTTGVLTPNSTGIYRVTASFSINIAASTSGSRAIQIQLYDVTTGANFIYNLPVPRDEIQVSGSFSVPFSAAIGDELVLRMASADVIAGITFELASFDITSIHLA